MNTAQMEQLEKMIDSGSVATVLNALAQICYAKEHHIKENWQDKATASVWRSAAGLISNIEDKVGC